jgi:hypothetical protein
MIKFNPKNIFILTICLSLLIGISYSTLRFGLSKDNVSFPKKDHSHFRIKYIFNGQEENFGSPRYQTDYAKDICDGSLTESPLHFHDNKPDYQHMHWARMTGGQFLKFYGLNKIGGLDSLMGFKLDSLPSITQVPIYGDHLPEPRSGDQFWIYTGLQNQDNSWTTKQRTLDELTNQDFETFFGKESQERKDIEKYGVLNILKPLQSKAHGGIEHKTATEEQKHLLELAEKANTELLNNQAVNSTQNVGAPGDAATDLQTEMAVTAQLLDVATGTATTSPQPSSKIITENKEVKLFDINQTPQPEIDPITGEELKAINNFLGDVVIFVQPDAPTDAQIQARFKNMVKLDKSSCGG